MNDRYLIALDIDGTVLREDGSLGDPTVAEIGRLRDLGHEVMLATGRSVAMTLPVLDRLGITPQYVVCSNGAITLRRDSSAPLGYAREYVETFDPSACWWVSRIATIQRVVASVPLRVATGAVLPDSVR